MKKLSTGFLFLVLLLTTLVSAEQKKAAASGLPPIIDRELIFGNPEIAAPQLSPDGKYSGVPEAVERYTQRLCEGRE